MYRGRRELQECRANPPEAHAGLLQPSSQEEGWDLGARRARRAEARAGYGLAANSVDLPFDCTLSRTAPAHPSATIDAKPGKRGIGRALVQPIPSISFIYKANLDAFDGPV
jgi:hypothetical protein